MRKTRKYLLKAAQEYCEELVKQFPSVEIDEIMPEGRAGADLWIALRAPADLVTDILYAAAKMNSEWEEKRNLSILATVRGKSSPVAV